MLRVLCLQHVPWTGPSGLADWARDRGHHWDTLVVPEAHRLPSPESHDLLVVMGGPMSLSQRNELAWLAGEQRYLEDCLARGRPVLGICLGAQMLAEIHGAPVRRGPGSEIGWFPLGLPPQPANHPVAGVLPAGLTTFFWHEEVFDTPAGGTCLAGTGFHDHQAFVAGRALALQFHLEVTPEWATHLARRDADQLTGGATVQSAAHILGQPSALYGRNHAVLARLIDTWLEAEQAGGQAPV